MANEAAGESRFKTSPKGTAGTHQFFVTPIKRVVDVQSMTTLPLAKGGRAML